MNVFNQEDGLILLNILLCPNCHGDLKLKIEESGNFHQFNDVIVMLEGVNYNLFSMPLFHKIPFDSSVNIISNKIIFKDILARIPGLGEYYQSTFREYPINKMIHSLHYMNDHD